MRQVNAVPDRPAQSPEEVKLILKTLQWTIHPDGVTQKRKRWNITNSRDAHVRAFAFKLLMGFLATLARQAAWYPEVDSRPELYSCANCHQPDETQEHIYECADHSEVEECFGAKFRSLQPAETSPLDTRPLRPWNSLVVPAARTRPSTLGDHDLCDASWLAKRGQQQRRPPSSSSSGPRSRRGTTPSGCHSASGPLNRNGAKGYTKVQSSAACEPQDTIARMPHNLPPPTYPPSFIELETDRREAYHRLIFQLMRGTDRRRVSE